jgi:hypothetical protein
MINRESWGRGGPEGPVLPEGSPEPERRTSEKSPEREAAGVGSPRH